MILLGIFRLSHCIVVGSSCKSVMVLVFENMLDSALYIIGDIQRKFRPREITLITVVLLHIQQ